MASITVAIRFNALPTIAANLKTGARAIVRKTGLDVEAGCKARSRVDTGVMRAGWTFRMTGDLSGEVSNAVEHAPFNEYGTATMSAQPMAHPAADAARPGFEAAVAKLAGL